MTIGGKTFVNKSTAKKINRRSNLVKTATVVGLGGLALYGASQTPKVLAKRKLLRTFERRRQHHNNQVWLQNKYRGPDAKRPDGFSKRFGHLLIF